MTIKRVIFTTSVAAAAAVMLTPAFLAGQAQGGLDPASIRKPLADTWPTYSGDYTGRRYSSLKQVNQTTVKNLSLAWTSRLTAGDPAAAAGGRGGFGGGRGGFGGGTPTPVIVGGEGTGEFAAGGAAQVKGAILQVDGTLYVTAPDNVWAIDARDGRELWHYYWKTKGGTHIGNRGVGDVAQLPLLRDAGQLPRLARRQDRQGALARRDRRASTSSTSRRWRRSSSTITSSSAPATTSIHPDSSSRSTPRRASCKWNFYTVPQKPGDPGLDTWPNLDAARHGGGQVWIPGSYDPETKLYIFGTGNPTPAYTGARRRATTSSPARSSR